MAIRRGSEWLRWDVHLHTPGTVLADEYPRDGWDEYVRRINAADPPAVALGITDYLSIEPYVEIRRRWLARELPGVQLVFPNVEFRLSLQTEKRRGINLHLLFSPEEPDHIDRIREKLGALSFTFRGEPYRCNRDGLIRLGSTCRPELRDERSRYVEGVNQFKVEFGRLREWCEADAWIRSNCLVAVDVGTNDGTSGLQKDGGFVAQRKEIERFAHIIFSSRPGDRSFWLGEGLHDGAIIEKEYGALKPCLHGSDAHCLDDVLNPAEERRCWIRAEPTFEGLKQILVEPAGRVHVGPEPPSRPRQNWIRSLTVSGAQWLAVPRVELNEGLVTIIGPRGSGKTALADLVALAADAYEPGPASFLSKAQALVGDARATVEWANHERPESRHMGGFPAGPPAVRYLSQHFVEQLCSAEGASDRLIEEIERVVFDAIDETERLGASSFSELRAIVTVGTLRQIDRLRAEVLECSAAVAREFEAKGKLGVHRARLKALETEVAALNKAIGDLAVKGKEEKLAKLRALQDEQRSLEKSVSGFRAAERRLTEIEIELQRLDRSEGQRHAELATELRALGIEETNLAAFRLQFAGDVSGILKQRVAAVQVEVARLSHGTAQPQEGSRALMAVRKELEALQKEISGDTEKERRFVNLQKKLRATQQERDKLDAEIKRIEQADERIKTAQQRRLDRYLDTFDELARQREALARLYGPLAERLAAAPPERRNLEFYVRCTVDVGAWAARGETLLDFRKRTVFQDRQSLANEAERVLGDAWRSGDREAVALGMTEFLTHFKEPSKILAPTATVGALAEWLFSTDHLRVTYGIRYEGTDIERLSPGTRGIVLLILYLALDDQDDRPLIIDQPEENLDPQSVFDVLAGYFRETRHRRQVIMVTHNPNLVVNTDADQVIVARAERVEPGALPRITWEAGALEDRAIRNSVCLILEGGEQAFLRREKRYALR